MQASVWDRAREAVDSAMMWRALERAERWLPGCIGSQLSRMFAEDFAELCGVSDCRISCQEEATITAGGAVCWRGAAPAAFAGAAGRTWPAGLAVPLKDRKGYVLGWLLAKTPVWSAAEERSVVALVELLAAKAGAVLSVRRALRINQELLEEISEAYPDNVLQAILDRAAQLTRADRGELARYNWKKDELLFRSRFPKDDPCGPVDGTPIPQDPSLIRTVWRTGERLLIPDVSRELRYHQCDPRTKSELVLRLEQQLSSGVRRLGVLNLESFALNHFDSQDLESVGQMAQQAVAQSLHVRRHIDFDEIMGLLSQPRPDPVKVAESLLESIRRNYGFDQGLIYRYVLPTRKLVAYAAIGIDLSTKPIEYAESERALAAKVFRDKNDYFSADPSHDPEVSKVGVELYDIYGGLLGLPLVIHHPDDKAAAEFVGALVVWSQWRNKKNPSPSATDCHLLRPFCRIAALALRAAEVQQRHTQFRDAIGACLRKMQMTLSAKENVAKILDSVQGMGFERARVFRLRHDNRLQPYDWRGMGPYESVLQRWRDYREPPEDVDPPAHVPWTRENPYVDRLLGSDETANPSDLFAHLCAPKEKPPGANPDWVDPWRDDPDGAMIGKQPRMPWISVALISAGRMYGELAVDNLGTSRPFTDDDLEYITFFGALAARAFAIQEKEGMLVQETLATLYSAVINEPRDWVARRRLLLYLIHGEEGLGFSRALLLQPDASGDCRVVDAVGPLDEASAQAEDRAQRRCRLSKFLAAAERHDNQSLMTAVKHLVVPHQDNIASYWGRFTAPAEEDCSRPGAPDWLRRLGEAIHANRVLIVPVRGDGEYFGLFVVDRRWRLRRTLSEAAKASLSTFAQEAAHLLVQHHLRNKAAHEADYANLGMLTKALAHELRYPLDRLLKTLATLKREILAVPAERMVSFLEPVQRNASQMARLINRLQALARPVEALAQVDLGELVRQYCEQKVPELRAQGTELRCSVPTDLPRILGIHDLLVVALDNLISNAQLALTNRQRGEKKIDIVVGLCPPNVVLQVIDNGPGIADEFLQKLKQVGTQLTSRPGRGLGLGLAIVRRVAFHHAGEFDLSSRSGTNSGMAATLSIPINRQGGDHV